MPGHSETESVGYTPATNPSPGTYNNGFGGSPEIGGSRTDTSKTPGTYNSGFGGSPEIGGNRTTQPQTGGNSSNSPWQGRYGSFANDPYTGQRVSSGLVSTTQWRYDPVAHRQYQSVANAAADYYGIPRSIFNAQIYVESGWNWRAVSSKGAVGIGQLMPGTAAAMGVTNAYDPVQNIWGTARYLAEMHKKFGDWSQALVHYNAGPYATNSKALRQGNKYATEILHRASVTDGSVSRASLLKHKDETNTSPAKVTSTNREANAAREFLSARAVGNIDASGLVDEFAINLRKLVEAGEKATGKRITFVSFARTNELQAQLYANYKQRTIIYNGVEYNPTRKGGIAARPGHSRHNYGMAADLSGDVVNDPVVYDWIKSNVGTYGIVPNRGDFNTDKPHLQSSKAPDGSVSKYAGNPFGVKEKAIDTTPTPTEKPSNTSPIAFPAPVEKAFPVVTNIIKSVVSGSNAPPAVKKLFTTDDNKSNNNAASSHSWTSETKDTADNPLTKITSMIPGPAGILFSGITKFVQNAPKVSTNGNTVTKTVEQDDTSGIVKVSDTISDGQQRFNSFMDQLFGPIKRDENGNAIDVPDNEFLRDPFGTIINGLLSNILIFGGLILAFLFAVVGIYSLITVKD